MLDGGGGGDSLSASTHTAWQLHTCWPVKCGLDFILMRAFYSLGSQLASCRSTGQRILPPGCWSNKFFSGRHSFFMGGISTPLPFRTHAHQEVKFPFLYYNLVLASLGLLRSKIKKIIVPNEVWSKKIALPNLKLKESNLKQTPFSQIQSIDWGDQKIKFGDKSIWI